MFGELKGDQQGCNGERREVRGMAGSRKDGDWLSCTGLDGILCFILRALRNQKKSQSTRRVMIACSFWKDHSACIGRMENRSEGRKLTQEAMVMF